MNCPRCKSLLALKSIKDINYTIDVDQCQLCEGIWFDKGELARLDKIIEPSLLEIRQIPSKKAQMENLNCPVCSRIMLKSDHPRDHKVIMDYCPVCQGIWLDKGELSAIQKENWLGTVGIIFRWMIGHS